VTLIVATSSLDLRIAGFRILLDEISLCFSRFREAAPFVSVSQTSLRNSAYVALILSTRIIVSLKNDRLLGR
jgi:hypothetical protein